jgi:hypothetical protein
VLEMLGLYNEKNISFFSFQDDDFAARSVSQRRWLMEFLNELKTNGLSNKVTWKISCRVDDLETQLLKRMLDHGLLAVYLGVESGNSVGLETLNKGISVEQNLAAVELLKNHNVAMAIGFMLFDPSSTLTTLKQNINFLRSVGEDGYFAINFCKMLPYAGTPIEAEMRRAGRLKGTLVQPDYSFLDPSIEWYEFLVQKIFCKRNFSPDGVVALLQRADFDWRLASYYSLPGADQYFGCNIKQITKRANLMAVNTLESLLDQIVAYDINFLLDEKKQLVNLFENEWQAEMQSEVDLRKLFALDSVATWSSLNRIT